jgi:hypothetical protein
VVDSRPAAHDKALTDHRVSGRTGQPVGRCGRSPGMRRGHLQAAGTAYGHVFHVLGR